MKAMQIFKLDVDSINPVIIGKAPEAESEWHKKCGIHVSTMRKYAWLFLEKSGIYYEMLENDKYYTQHFGKYEESKIENGEEFLYIHYPNGIMKMSRVHGKEILFFKNPIYGKNIDKPKDPGPCKTKSCENSWIYSFGTAYPCSHCIEIESYKLQLKDYNANNGESA